MPYIEKKHRARLDPLLAPVLGAIAGTDAIAGSPAGELNYCITRLVHAFLGTSPRYHDFNEAIGALECAKLELYRRRIAAYEDTKIAQSGDVP